MIGDYTPIGFIDGVVPINAANMERIDDKVAELDQNALAVDADIEHLQKDMDDAMSTAESAQSTAKSAQSVAESAQSRNTEQDSDISSNAADISALKAENESLKSQLAELESSKAPTSHASSATTYGAGTTSNYGHCRTINNLTTSSHTNGYALSAYQGYVLNQNIANIQTDLNTGRCQLFVSAGWYTQHTVTLSYAGTNAAIVFVFWNNHVAIIQCWGASATCVYTDYSSGITYSFGSNVLTVETNATSVVQVIMNGSATLA